MHARADDSSEPPAGLDDPAPRDPMPWQQLHALLRGRYHWAILIPLLWGAVGWLAVQELTHPVYRSEGAVQVRAYVPPVLWESTGETGVMPMARSFAEAQARLLVSEQVLSAALEDPAWKRMDVKQVPESPASLRSMLRVGDPSRESLVIRVTSTHRDPLVAHMATRTVIDAYMAEREAGEGESGASRRQVLEQRERDLTARMRELREQIYEIAREFGSDDLDQAYNHQLTQLNERESAINDVQLELAGLTSEAASQEEEPETRRSLSIEEIAVLDSHMQELIHQRRAMRRQLENLAEAHPDRPDTVASLREHEKLIEQYAEAYRATRSTPPDERGERARRIATLQDRLARLKELYAEARQETLRLGRKKLEIDRLKSEQEMVGQRLAETQRRLEQLKVESKAGERVEVVSRGNSPGAPANTSKRQQLAVLALFGAGLVGFGMVLLSDVVDPRVLNSQDILDGGDDIRILGMLPVLPEEPVNDERAARATHAIHHMRSMLQILLRQRPEEKVFAVTSPAALSGKTSLVLSLGLSFAASGSRTLLVDTDLAGGGLTRRLRAIVPRLIGRILIRKGLVTGEQMNAALEVAQAEGRRIGEVLVKQGVVSEAALAEALELQKKKAARVGFIDVLEGESPTDCVVEVGIPNLSVLPVGDGVASDMTRVGPRNIERLISEVRGGYDQIIIDTGPMGGDVVSHLLAAEADGVILCVSRGEIRRAVRRSFKQIRSIGARLIGVVFNRANTRDLARSIHSVDPSQSISASGERTRKEEIERIFIDEKLLAESPLGEKVNHFDPIAHAVVRTAGSLYQQAGGGNGNGAGERDGPPAVATQEAMAGREE